MCDLMAIDRWIFDATNRTATPDEARVMVLSLGAQSVLNSLILGGKREEADRLRSRIETLCRAAFES